MILIADVFHAADRIYIAISMVVLILGIIAYYKKRLRRN